MQVVCKSYRLYVIRSLKLFKSKLQVQCIILDALSMKTEWMNLQARQLPVNSSLSNSVGSSSGQLNPDNKFLSKDFHTLLALAEPPMLAVSFQEFTAISIGFCHDS